MTSVFSWLFMTLSWLSYELFMMFLRLSDVFVLRYVLQNVLMTLLRLFLIACLWF